MSDVDLESLIITLPHYPQPEIFFKDVTPVFASPEGLKAAVDQIADAFKDAGITKVVGAEARGFMLAAPVAYALGAGFVPARKPGKLPRATISQEYALEYGTDKLEIHADALCEDDVVLLVDDLIATGGTCVAQIKMIQELGAKVAGLAFLIELAYCKPRALLAEVTDAPIKSLVIVEAEKEE